jgi:hypothetical protein
MNVYLLCNLLKEQNNHLKLMETATGIAMVRMGTIVKILMEETLQEIRLRVEHKLSKQGNKMILCCRILGILQGMIR